MKTDYTNQVFGNRLIIRNYCYENDWKNIGKSVPKNISKYRLSKCLVCGKIIPVLIGHLKNSPPKSCSFCSNMNHKSAISSSTNVWMKYDNYAVLNILHSNRIVQTYIDLSDFDKVSSLKWRAVKKRNKTYVITGSGNKQIYLHRFIIGISSIPKGCEVDHIDGNSLNNLRSNLRVVSRIDNIINSKVRIDNKIGIRGISKCGKSKYNTDFSYKSIRFYFKHWDSIEEAVWCRKIAEEYFGIKILKNNTLAKQYLNLPEITKKDVENHTLHRIIFYLNNGKPSV